MGKYLPEVFLQTEQRRSEVCAKKTEGANEINKTFIIWLLVNFYFFLLFTLPLSMLVSLHVYTGYAFICLAY